MEVLEDSLVVVFNFQRSKLCMRNGCVYRNHYYIYTCWNMNIEANDDVITPMNQN